MRIYLNQAGYRPLDEKIIIVAEEMPLQNEEALNEQIILRICDNKGNEIKQKKAGYFGFDKDSGDHVWKAHVSEIDQPGEYKISADVVAGTVTMIVSDDVYCKINKLLCKALYYQRCGTKLEEEYAGIYKRPCCHTEPAFLLEDFNQKCPVEVSGGWHDAGDYGRYTTAAATALAHILYAYKFFPDSFQEPLNIPESGNDIPDVLNECLYELNWLFKMQREDGSVCHKLTSMRHANFVMPYEDKRQMILFPASTMATADFAAVMTLAVGVYKEYDPVFAKKAMQAAKRAWNWLEEHQYFIGFKNPAKCNTGEYDDIDDRDERMWAAAELYRCTGEKKYLEAVEMLSDEKIDLTAMGWADVGGFAGWAILAERICGNNMEPMSGLEEKFASAFLDRTEKIERMCNNSGYYAAMETDDYEWGSNMVLMNRAMIAATSYMLKKTPEWKNIVSHQLDYLLGVNATGYSYITAVGKNACNNPHNRVTVAGRKKATIPGFVVGGPCSEPADEKAQWIINADTPPMKCYADVWECYSLNEITIYWNSPAIFMTAFLTSHKCE